MILPLAPSAPNLFNPKNLLLYGIPLTGKTSFLRSLPEPYLIVDLDGTAGYETCCRVTCANFMELIDVMFSIERANKPYKYLALDSLTTLEAYCIPAATEAYNNSPMASKEGKISDVRNLPRGGGYRWLYDKFLSVVDKFSSLSEYSIYIGHARDKYDEEVTKIMVEGKAELKSVATESVTEVLNLTGKLANTFLTRMHAVGLMRKNGKVEFNGTEDRYGARCKHLNNATIDRDWSKIYV